MNWSQKLFVVHAAAHFQETAFEGETRTKIDVFKIYFFNIIKHFLNGDFSKSAKRISTKLSTHTAYGL